MSIEFEISEVIPASPEVVYAAWLDSDGHSRMTGSKALFSAIEGASFEAWDGYIRGVNLQLDYPSRILQLWRTSEFDEDDPDSRLEVLISPEGRGARVTIRHSELPEHGLQYKQGWVDNYFTPMIAYFGGEK